MVNKGCDVTLSAGDSFGLLPDLCWFKIVESSMDSQPNTPDIAEFRTLDDENGPDTEPYELGGAAGPVEIKSEIENGEVRSRHKRKLPLWLTQMSPKKSKNETTNKDDGGNEVDDNVASTSTMAIDWGSNANACGVDAAHAEPPEEMIVPVNPESIDATDATPGPSGVSGSADSNIRIKEEPADEAVTIKQEPINDCSDDNQNVASTSASVTNHNQNDVQNIQVKEEPTDSQDVSSSSAGLRESCTYGIRCYR